jgi:hypothetical protein
MCSIWDGLGSKRFPVARRSISRAQPYCEVFQLLRLYDVFAIVDRKSARSFEPSLISRVVVAGPIDKTQTTR